MPQPHLSQAITYLSRAADQLLDDDRAASAALFAGVECLEIQCQLSEYEHDEAPDVAPFPPAAALAMAAELLSRDARPEVGDLAQRLRELSRAVS